MCRLIGHLLSKLVSFCDIIPLHENAGNIATLIEDGLVDKIDESLFQLSIGHSLQLDWHGAPDKRLASLINPIELLQKALWNDFRQHLR